MTQAPPNPQEPPPAALVHPVNSDRSPWNWLLLIPIVLPLLVPIYNRWTPKLFGFRSSSGSRSCSRCSRPR